MSIISQREMTIDTATFPTALRACLRQSPDVIQLGEMRDMETIRAAMTAAETGHLLLTTLHTRSAVSTASSTPSLQNSRNRFGSSFAQCCIL